MHSLFNWMLHAFENPVGYIRRVARSSKTYPSTRIRNVHPLESVAASSEKRTDDNVISLIRVNANGVTLEMLQSSLDYVWNSYKSLRVVIKPKDNISRLRRARRSPKVKRINVKSFEALSDKLSDMVYAANEGYDANLLVGIADIDDDLRQGPFGSDEEKRHNEIVIYVASAHSFHDGKSHALFLSDIVSHMYKLPMQPRMDDNKTPIELHTNPENPFQIQFKGFPMPGFEGDLSEKGDARQHPFIKQIDMGWDNFSIIKEKCTEHNVSTASFFHALLIMTARQMCDEDNFNSTSMVAFDNRRAYSDVDKQRFGMHVVMPPFTLDVTREDTIWSVAKVLKSEYSEADIMLRSSCPKNIKHWKEGDQQTSTMSRGFEMGGLVASSPGYHQFSKEVIEAAGITGYWAFSAFNSFFTSGLWSCGVPEESSVLILSLSKVLYSSEKADAIHSQLQHILKDIFNM